MDYVILREFILKHVPITYFVTEKGKGGIDHTLTDCELLEYELFAEIPEIVTEEWFDQDLQTAYQTAKEFSRYRNLNNFDDYEKFDTTEHNFFDKLSNSQQTALVAMAFILKEDLLNLRYLKTVLISNDYEEAAIALKCSNIFDNEPALETDIMELLREV